VELFADVVAIDGRHCSRMASTQGLEVCLGLIKGIAYGNGKNSPRNTDGIERPYGITWFWAWAKGHSTRIDSEGKGKGISIEGLRF
jgi:hypothetical protein